MFGTLELVDELIHPATKRIISKVVGFYHSIKVTLDAEAAVEKFLIGIYQVWDMVRAAL